MFSSERLDVESGKHSVHEEHLISSPHLMGIILNWEWMRRLTRFRCVGWTCEVSKLKRSIDMRMRSRVQPRQNFGASTSPLNSLSEQTTTNHNGRLRTPQVPDAIHSDANLNIRPKSRLKTLFGPPILLNTDAICNLQSSLKSTFPSRYLDSLLSIIAFMLTPHFRVAANSNVLATPSLPRSATSWLQNSKACASKSARRNPRSLIPPREK
jgi:hypothetical protein